MLFNFHVEVVMHSSIDVFEVTMGSVVYSGYIERAKESSVIDVGARV